MSKGMKYRNGASIVDAVQWRKNGDHPEDGTERFTSGEFAGELYEGKVVRYFRRPDIDGETVCFCGDRFHVHGWLDLEDITVCPGDFVITDARGVRSRMTPEAFAETYEPA